MIGSQSAYSIIKFTILALIGGSTLCLGAPQNGTELLETFAELDTCFVQSVYSFYYTSSYPPSSTDDLKAACKSQAEGFKCLKEKSKNVPALIKRGINSFLMTRQRYNRKYCKNFNSFSTKQYVNDLKCIMDKKLPVLRDIDINFVSQLYEIRRRNYNDSATELKYLCCSIINYRKKIIDGVGPECQASKPTMEEMILSIVSNDINLICDDEDKLTLKVCPTLEPFKITKPTEFKAGETGAAATTMYLLMTLGEPDTALMK